MQSWGDTGEGDSGTCTCPPRWYVWRIKAKGADSGRDKTLFFSLFTTPEKVRRYAAPRLESCRFCIGPLSVQIAFRWQRPRPGGRSSSSLLRTSCAAPLDLRALIYLTLPCRVRMVWTHWPEISLASCRSALPRSWSAEERPATCASPRRSPGSPISTSHSGAHASTGALAAAPPVARTRRTCDTAPPRHRRDTMRHAYIKDHSSNGTFVSPQLGLRTLAPPVTPRRTSGTAYHSEAPPRATGQRRAAREGQEDQPA